MVKLNTFMKSECKLELYWLGCRQLTRVVTLLLSEKSVRIITGNMVSWFVSAAGGAQIAFCPSIEVTSDPSPADLFQ